ncbi:MAG: hypothetical protein M3063_09335 [Actinomycetota bacterium]|nr:hypothetical protein [Actinomycetota bacterium]
MAQPNPEEQAAQNDIAGRLGDAGFALPGTYLDYSHVCGKPNCRCTADPPRPHGPYHRWTRKIDGKTVTRRLTAEQIRLYGPWFEEAQRLRALLSELEALSLRIAQRGGNGL